MVALIHQTWNFFSYIYQAGRGNLWLSYPTQGAAGQSILMSPKCLLVKTYSFVSDWLNVITCPLSLWDFYHVHHNQGALLNSSIFYQYPQPRRIDTALLSRDAGAPSPVYISGLGGEIIYKMECPPSYLQAPSYLLMSLNYFLLFNLTISGTWTFLDYTSSWTHFFLSQKVNYQNHSELAS